MGFELCTPFPYVIWSKSVQSSVSSLKKVIEWFTIYKQSVIRYIDNNWFFFLFFIFLEKNSQHFNEILFWFWKHTKKHTGTRVPKFLALTSAYPGRVHWKRTMADSSYVVAIWTPSAGRPGSEQVGPSQRRLPKSQMPCFVQRTTSSRTLLSPDMAKGDTQAKRNEALYVVLLRFE